MIHPRENRNTLQAFSHRFLPPSLEKKVAVESNLEDLEPIEKKGLALKLQDKIF